MPPWSLIGRAAEGGARGGCSSSCTSREKWSDGTSGWGHPMTFWDSQGPSGAPRRPSTLRWDWLKKM